MNGPLEDCGIPPLPQKRGKDRTPDLQGFTALDDPQLYAAAELLDAVVGPLVAVAVAELPDAVAGPPGAAVVADELPGAVAAVAVPPDAVVVAEQPDAAATAE